MGFNVEAGEEAAITGGGKYADRLVFHWSNWSNVAIVFRALLTMIWVVRSKWLKRRKVEAERRDFSKKIEVTKLTKNEVEKKVTLHVDRLEKVLQSQILPLMQMNLNIGGMVGLGDRNDPARSSWRALSVM